MNKKNKTINKKNHLIQDPYRNPKSTIQMACHLCVHNSVRFEVLTTIHSQIPTQHTFTYIEKHVQKRAFDRPTIYDQWSYCKEDPFSFMHIYSKGLTDMSGIVSFRVGETWASAMDSKFVIRTNGRKRFKRRLLGELTGQRKT